MAKQIDLEEIIADNPNVDLKELKRAGGSSE
jgi:hypothetical protein